jgi:very-short-patch-repair endonuclease
MWLFHSVQPGDLSRKDLRFELLRYMLKPSTTHDGVTLGVVSPHVRHPAFDSLFEQRVYLAIKAKGYRVRPQYPAGRYKIDLVIEGGTKRLAVECDGDAFHSGEAEIEDAARQRDLERVGWTFWRVRGSVFFRDPELALGPLWDLLSQHEIEPVEEAAWGSREGLVAGVPAPTQVNLDSTHDARDAAISAAFRKIDTSPAPQSPPVHTRITAPPTPQAGPIASTADAYATTEGSRPSAAAQPNVTATATGSRARFRAGKMLLSSAARRRVTEELSWIQQWLDNPPPVSGLDARSAGVLRQRQERQRDDLLSRQEYLTRVIHGSVEDAQAGHDWITPGCLFAVIIGPAADEGSPEATATATEGDVEWHVITSADHAAGQLKLDSSMPPESFASAPQDGPSFEGMSPFTDLAKAIEGCEVGDAVRYATSRGTMAATVVAIAD